MSIGSSNDLELDRRQAINWIDDDPIESDDMHLVRIPRYVCTWFTLCCVLFWCYTGHIIPCVIVQISPFVSFLDFECHTTPVAYVVVPCIASPQTSPNWNWIERPDKINTFIVTRNNPDEFGYTNNKNQLEAYQNKQYTYFMGYTELLWLHIVHDSYFIKYRLSAIFRSGIYFWIWFYPKWSQCIFTYPQWHFVKHENML